MKFDQSSSRSVGRVLLLAVMLFSRHSYADGTNQWNVQVTGLRVIAPPTDAKPGYNAALSAPPGVAVEIRLTPPYGRVILIKQLASKVTSFADDKGTDLLAVKTDNPFSKPGFGVMDRGNGSHATVDIRAAGLPATGATSLDISGKVVMEIATGTNQFTVENVEMKTNTTFEIDNLPVTISDVGTNTSPFRAKEYNYFVRFTGPGDLNRISDLEFFDPQGTKIKAHKRAWGASTLEYEIATKVARVKIVATRLKGFETVEVPISVKAGLGL